MASDPTRPGSDLPWRGGVEQPLPDGPGNGLAPPTDTQPGVDRARVVHDGLGADSETVCDLLVGQAGGKQLHDLDLAYGEDPTGTGSLRCRQCLFVDRAAEAPQILLGPADRR